ncbi:MAG TPA: dethiobiotin synthase [Methylibium sp.]
MSPAWFVTGTDTGIGKTRASCALLHALRRAGHAAVGMKPVAAGTEPGADGSRINEDVQALREASALRVPAELDNPVLLDAATSPHIAARRARRCIELAPLAAACAALRERAGAVVVEGAGGFCVPLSDTETGADLATLLGLPVILVVGLRLGCLNHALLTQEAIAARGLRLAGWVANRIDPHMQAQDENLEFLRTRLRAPMLADWPWAPGVSPRDLHIELPAFHA